MPLDIVLNLFSDLLIIIRDEYGNVIYPNDAQILQFIDELKPIKSQNHDELVHPDSKRFYKILNTSYHEGFNTYHITRYIEITDHKKREKELQTDETTGLIIKKAAYKEFNDYIRECISNGEEFSTILVDADYFKRVNDTYGHLAGDYVLRYIADTLHNQTRHSESRPKDLVGRIGGEEFLVVLKNIPATITLQRMNQIRESIADSTIVFEGQPINITCSFGVVHVPSKEIKLVPKTPEKIDMLRSQLQHTADLQLYKAKESGRNQVISELPKSP